MIQPIRVAINFSTPDNNIYKAVSELQNSGIRVQDIVDHIMKNLIGTQNIPKDYFVDSKFSRKYAGQSLKNGDSIYIKVNQDMFEEWIKPASKVQQKSVEQNFKNQKALEDTAQTKDVNEEQREQISQKNVKVKQYEEQAKSLKKISSMQGKMQFKLKDIKIGQYQNENQSSKQVQDNSSKFINQKSPKSPSKIILPPIELPVNSVIKQNPDQINEVQNQNQPLLKNARQQNNIISQQKELPVINPVQPNHRNLNQMQAKQKVQQDSCCRII